MEQPREQESETAVALLEAAEQCLRRYGMGGFSTRKVAEAAGMPLSQIHYHFGSKRGLLLGLLDYQNRKLLARQEQMYAEPQPLWQRWMQACDYLEEDLASGYVRVLQEMIAAGWSDSHIAAEVRRLLGAWYELLRQVAEEATQRLNGVGPFTPTELATLAGHWFLAAESMILLGFSEEQMPTRSALRKVGALLQQLEARQQGGRDHARKVSGS